MYFQGRNGSKPIAICVAEIEEIYRWANVTVSRQVIEDLLPGQVLEIDMISDYDMLKIDYA